MTSLQRAAGLTAANGGGGFPTSSGESAHTSSSAGVRRSRPGSIPNTNNTHATSNNNNMPKRGGMFEASFGGLDLSEFGASASSSSSSAVASSSTPPMSAAAALLREKTREAERTQREAEEEAIMQANAVALAQEQTKRLAAMKAKQDVEGRDNGRSNHLLNGGTGGGGRARPADGMEFLGQGMFSTLVNMHGNDDHGAKREASSSSHTKSAVSARSGTVAKSTKLADAVASKRGGASTSTSKRISRLAKISSKKSPSSGPNKGGLVGKKNQRSKGAIKKGKRSKF